MPDQVIDVGDVFDETSLLKWMDLSQFAVAERVENRQMIGCKTTDGHWVFPAWQFMEGREVIPGIAEVLHILSDCLDSWAASRWFVVPSPDLPEGASAIEWLTQGGDLELVLNEAKRDAERFSH